MAENVIQLPTTRSTGEPWVSRKELAEHLGVCLKTVDNLVRAGMPSLKLGKSRRFRVSAVEGWLEHRGAA